MAHAPKAFCVGRLVVLFPLLLSWILLRNRGETGLSNVCSTSSLWTFLQQVEDFNLLHNLLPFLSKAALSARFSSVSCSVFQISMCSACWARHAHSSNLNSLFPIQGIHNPEGLNHLSKNGPLWIPVCRTRKPFQHFCAPGNKVLICILYSPSKWQ